MEPKEKMERLAQSGEDRVLLARVWERLEGGRRRNIPAFTAFLSLREQELVRRLMGEENLTFFGGYPGAERAVACFLPDYLEEDDLGEEGPVACLRATFFEKDTLSHRDFLGSLMGAGIKRETVGDICVGKGQCDFFLLSDIAPYVEQNLVSAGRTKLHLERIPLAAAEIPVPETLTRQDTLASLRLDSVIGAGFRVSRNQAVRYVLSGAAAVDGLPCEKPDRILTEGAVVSVRGLGKIRLTLVKGQTRKGRLSVEIEKFV